MFGISYIKVAPTTHVIHFKSGKVVREGTGLSFFYFSPNSIITLVPAGSIDVPFMFEEATSDFQDITIQGQLTFRITAPSKIASLLDFSVDRNQRYRSSDHSKLDERLIHATQILARSFTQNLKLKDVLVSSDTLVNHLTEGLKTSEVVTMLGIEVLGTSIMSIKAMPEMAKALQADAREELLRQAENAI